MEEIDRNKDKSCNEKNKRIFKIIFFLVIVFVIKPSNVYVRSALDLNHIMKVFFLLKIFFFVLSQSLIYLLSFISKKIYVLHFWFSE